MSTEFERIARIEAILRRASPDVALGIGDDCAVLTASACPRVWTIDAAVEGVHFSRAFMTLEQIGFRSFMAAASDLAAMGARAVAALSALTLPTSLADEELTQIVNGLARAADACKCPIVGGNLARASELTLTTSLLGECAGRVITRRGAAVGEAIYLTGPVGAAALGLRALERGLANDARFAEVTARFLTPTARFDAAPTIAELASAAIDVSDGLAQDLTHLCRASRVGARIEAALIPRSAHFDELARLLECEGLALALSGGEDYELIFTAPAAAAPELATRIGTITDVAGSVIVVDGAGKELAFAPGFDHFAES